MIKTMTWAALAALTLLSGCNKAESPKAVANDVAEAQRDASKDVADAQRDVSKDVQDANKTIKNDQADVQLAKVEEIGRASCRERVLWYV